VWGSRGAGTPGALKPEPGTSGCPDLEGGLEGLLTRALDAERTARCGSSAAGCRSSCSGGAARGESLMPMTEAEARGSSAAGCRSSCGGGAAAGDALMPMTEAEADAYDASEDTAENTLTYLTACGLSVGSAQSAQTGAAPAGARRPAPGSGAQPPLCASQGCPRGGASVGGAPPCDGPPLLGGWDGTRAGAEPHGNGQGHHGGQRAGAVRPYIGCPLMGTLEGACLANAADGAAVWTASMSTGAAPSRAQAMLADEAILAGLFVEPMSVGNAAECSGSEGSGGGGGGGGGGGTLLLGQAPEAPLPSAPCAVWREVLQPSGGLLEGLDPATRALAGQGLAESLGACRGLPESLPVLGVLDPRAALAHGGPLAPSPDGQEGWAVGPPETPPGLEPWPAGQATPALRQSRLQLSLGMGLGLRLDLGAWRYGSAQGPGSRSPGSARAAGPGAAAPAPGQAAGAGGQGGGDRRAPRAPARPPPGARMKLEARDAVRRCPAARVCIRCSPGEKPGARCRAAGPVDAESAAGQRTRGACLSAGGMVGMQLPLSEACWHADGVRRSHRCIDAYAYSRPMSW